MPWSRFLPYLAVMAGVTYLIRALPLTLVRRRIRNSFFRSFLYYIPYAVLTAMTIPDILYSTGFTGENWLAFAGAAGGLCAAGFMALRGHGLLTVALTACGAVALIQSVAFFI